MIFHKNISTLFALDLMLNVEQMNSRFSNLIIGHLNMQHITLHNIMIKVIIFKTLLKNQKKNSLTTTIQLFPSSLGHLHQ